jgi:hypothetical protein
MFQNLSEDWSSDSDHEESVRKPIKSQYDSTKQSINISQDNLITKTKTDDETYQHYETYVNRKYRPDLEIYKPKFFFDKEKNFSQMINSKIYSPEKEYNLVKSKTNLFQAIKTQLQIKEKSTKIKNKEHKGNISKKNNYEIQFKDCENEDFLNSSTIIENSNTTSHHNVGERQNEKLIKDSTNISD